MDFLSFFTEYRCSTVIQTTATSLQILINDLNLYIFPIADHTLYPI